MISLKVCSSCKLEKSLENFGKDRSREDGLDHRCKICKNGQLRKNYRLHHPEKLEKYKANLGFKFCRNKRCRLIGIEQPISNFGKKASAADGLDWWCRECVNIGNNNYYLYNKDVIIQYKGVHYKKRRYLDLLFRLKTNLRSRLTKLLKAKSWPKNNHFIKYIGCTPQYLKLHIENQFQSGMTWDNYGKGLDKWNVDHISPLSLANTEEELYALCHYSNLQPLWELDNLKKSNKILVK
jgi:hypothetical protein